MKKVMAKIKRCNTNPELNGLIIDDMEVSPISTKRPRMTIEDLAKIVEEGFKKQDEFNKMVLGVFERNNLK